LAVIEKAEAAAGRLPNAPIRQVLTTNQIAAVEVRDNLWQDRGIEPLSQIYIHCKDSPEALLIYQDRWQRHAKVLKLASRLADRWEARLVTDELE
jgi:hypothetical protein